MSFRTFFVFCFLKLLFSKTKVHTRELPPKSDLTTESPFPVVIPSPFRSNPSTTATPLEDGRSRYIAFISRGLAGQRIPIKAETRIPTCIRERRDTGLVEEERTPVLLCSTARIDMRTRKNSLVFRAVLVILTNSSS
jgi:hypothetical protein